MYPHHIMKDPYYIDEILKHQKHQTVANTTSKMKQNIVNQHDEVNINRNIYTEII